MPEIRKVLKDAYPFGDRRWWPYKVWCDEIRFQLGIKKQNPEPFNPKLYGMGPTFSYMTDIPFCTGDELDISNVTFSDEVDSNVAIELRRE